MRCRVWVLGVGVYGSEFGFRDFGLRGEDPGRI